MSSASYDPSAPPYAGFFGVMGASAAIIFSCKFSFAWTAPGLRNTHVGVSSASYRPVEFHYVYVCLLLIVCVCGH